MVRHPLLTSTLSAACALWASHARAQAPGDRVLPCPQRWTYDVGETAYYLGPLFVSDSAGDLFWWENTGTAELVAVRDGRTRWRRRLSSMTGPGGFVVNAALMRDNLLVVAFKSTVEGLRTSDGRIVWSRDLQADLSAELRKAKLPKNTELETSVAARVGGALVTATTAGYSGAWLTATGVDGKPVWRRHIGGALARMVADRDRLYGLLSQTSGNEPPIIALNSSGREVVPPPGMPRSDSRVPFDVSMALRGDEVVFDQEHAVTALIAPAPTRCPPGAPCRPSPFMLTVTGFSAGQERWHLSHTVGGILRTELLLLSDRSVLLVDNERVGRIAPDGELTQLCELPADQRGPVVGLVHGDLVVADHRSVGAYTLPGAPQLAATGWVMRGGGPAQSWAVQAAPAGGPAPAALSAAPFVRFPAGVADPTADVAYVQTNGGVTTALALAHGTGKWRTQSPAKPVGSWNGRVVVLEPARGQPGAHRKTDAATDTAPTGALRVAQLDPASGAEVATSQPIPTFPLPNGVPSPFAPWGTPFWSDVRIEGDRAHVSWEVIINGGAGRAGIQTYGASRRAEGDPKSGAVFLFPNQPLDRREPSPTPAGPLTPPRRRRQYTPPFPPPAATTRTDAKSGKKLWTIQLWSIARPDRVMAPPG